jgi:hypothetical protein
MLCLKCAFCLVQLVPRLIPRAPHCSCQQPIGNGTGYDAGKGAYQDYLGSCSNPQSFKLPTDIQTAVCNEKIKIANDIYSNGWEDGSWF